MIRIINIVENLDKGAVENWLVKAFLESRKYRPGWKWTFYCVLGKPGRLDDIVKEAGGEIIYSPYWISNKYKFLASLRRVLKKGNYDIIHSHHDYLSGFYLIASAGIKFRRRILHIHNTDKGLPVSNPYVHSFLLRVFRLVAFYFSDIIVGVSKNALEEFIRGKKTDDKRFKVLYCGIDFKAFVDPVKSGFLKQKFNLPADSKILLFVGRMNSLKNPVFVVDVLSEIAKVRSDVYVLFVGEGDLLLEVQKRAREQNILDRILINGWSNEISKFMKDSDLFIFPRLEYPKEGLGLVIVEAQAAGLPLLISRGIVEDAIEIKELAHIVPLKNNPKEWAEKAMNILDSEPALNRSQAMNIMMNSKFALGNATENLIALYEGKL